MPDKPKILTKKVVAQSQFFTIEDLHLHFSNGVQRHYERIRGPLTGAVMVLPILNADTILLIREYAAGVDDYVLGFPKGAIEKHEDLLTTANRELMEEAGYAANHLECIGRLSSAPGYSAAMMDLILAKDLYQKKQLGDEPEPIEVIPWQLKKIDALLSHPEFYEARSIAALFMLMRKLDA